MSKRVRKDEHHNEETVKKAKVQEFSDFQKGFSGPFLPVFGQKQAACPIEGECFIQGVHGRVRLFGVSPLGCSIYYPLDQMQQITKAFLEVNHCMNTKDKMCKDIFVSKNNKYKITADFTDTFFILLELTGDPNGEPDEK